MFARRLAAQHGLKVLNLDQVNLIARQTWAMSLTSWLPSNMAMPTPLLPLVYDELRKLVARKMANEAAGQTRQPTALVHEVWMRLVGKETRNSKIALISSPPCSGLTLSRVERPKALK